MKLVYPSTLFCLANFPIAIAIAVVALLAPSAASAQGSPDALFQSPPASNRLIIKLNPLGTDDTVGELQTEIDATVIHQLDSIGAEVWEITGDSSDVVAAYQNDPRIAFIEPDAVITLDLPDAALLETGQAGSPSLAVQSAAANDSYFSYQWALHNSGQDGGTADADIDGLEAWGILTGTNVVVGVIDSGVAYTHTDLAQNMWINPGEIAGNNIDDDENGFVDDIHGWDFFDNDSDPSDSGGHGTHVAGTIAAVSNNSSGVAGVSWNAQIMALRFIGPDGWGYLSDAIAAIEYATLMDAKLTNNSWGGGGYYQAMYDAIDAANQAGILFIAAAGNDTTNTDVSPAYPASYDLENVISVASTTRDDELSSFSNYGLNSVDLGAPGSNILSTYLDNGYAFLNGTSMASPHVAGAAALLWSAFPDAEASHIKARLLDSVDPIAALQGQVATAGRLNLHQALIHQYTAPKVELSTTTLSYDLTAGEAISTTITLTNSGDATLDWRSAVTYTVAGLPSGSSTGWLTLTPTMGQILSGTTTALNLMIDTTDLISGLHEAELTIISNDPDSPNSMIRITAAVTVPLYPLVSIPSLQPATYWPDAAHPDPTMSQASLNQVDIPIEFMSNDFEIGATIFSLDFDETCLGFDDSDENEDGVPDTIFVDIPDPFSVSILYDPADTDGELDFLFADLSSPISALSDGLLATVRFTLLCHPGLTETMSAPIHFGNNPTPSFSDLEGASIPGSAESGSVAIGLGLWSGDCNGDAMIGAADVSAVIWEIFDGDGNQWLSASGGTFPGSEGGCDANGDKQIDAGDLTCTVLLLFDGHGACQIEETLTGADESSAAVPDENAAQLAIGRPNIDEDSPTVHFPIHLEQSRGLAGAISLSISYEPTIFAFDSTDANEDGLPDAVQTALAGEHVVSIVHNVESHQLELVVADLTPNFGAQSLLTALPDGELLTIAFQLETAILIEADSLANTVANPVASTLAGYFADDTPPVDFAFSVEPSIGDLAGQSRPVQTVNRAQTAQPQTAILPPATTFPDLDMPADNGGPEREAVEDIDPADSVNDATQIQLFMPIIGP